MTVLRHHVRVCASKQNEMAAAALKMSRSAAHPPLSRRPQPPVCVLGCVGQSQEAMGNGITSSTQEFKTTSPSVTT